MQVRSDDDGNGTATSKALSFRFSERDLALLVEAMKRAGTDNRTEALRAALKFYVGEKASPVDGKTRAWVRELVREEFKRELSKVRRALAGARGSASESDGDAS